MNPGELPALSSEYTRRLALKLGLGSAGLATLGLMGFDMAPPAFGATALESAVAEAMSFKTKTAAQISSAIVDTTWKGNQPTNWCAWLASYLVRANGMGRQSSSFTLYGLFPQHVTPAVGDVIYYKKAGVTDGHTGFVVGVSSTGVPQTIEGNTRGDPTIAQYYSKPWDQSAVVGYARPDWGGVSSGPTNQNRRKAAVLLYQVNDTNGKSWLIVFNGKARVLTSGADDSDAEWQQFLNLFGNPIAVSRDKFNRLVTFYGGVAI